MRISHKSIVLTILSLIMAGCTLSAPNAKIDANVDQSTQKGTSSNSSDGKSGAVNPQQIVVNVNNNPNINTNINPNISNSSTTNNANNQNNSSSGNTLSSSSPSSSNAGSIGTSQTKYKILYTVRGNRRDIFSANIDGSLKTKLTNAESNESNYFPVSSPDASKIAFNDYDNLYVMNSDGTGKIPIIKSSFNGPSGQPSWASDGTKIYYQDASGIFSINPDGTQKTMVLPQSYGLAFIRISPDNRKLAYILSSGTGDVLTTVGVSGVGETQITDSSKILVNKDSNICWTLNGKSIIFSGYLPEEQSKLNKNTDIYQINIDGTGLKKLTDNLGQENYPSISSDGKLIVFETKNLDDGGIYTMTSDGKNQQLVINGNDAEEPSFITTGIQNNVTSTNSTSSPSTTPAPIVTPTVNITNTPSSPSPIPTQPSTPNPIVSP